MKTRITTNQETGCFNGWADGRLIAQAPTRDACKTYLAAHVISAMGFIVELVSAGAFWVDTKGNADDLKSVERVGRRFGLDGCSLKAGRAMLHN